MYVPVCAEDSGWQEAQRASRVAPAAEFQARVLRSCLAEDLICVLSRFPPLYRVQGKEFELQVPTLTRSLVDRSPTDSMAYAAVALAFALRLANVTHQGPLAPIFLPAQSITKRIETTPLQELARASGIQFIAASHSRELRHDPKRLRPAPVAAHEREAIALDLRQLLLVPEAQLEQPPLQPAQVVFLWCAGGHVSPATYIAADQPRPPESERTRHACRSKGYHSRFDTNDDDWLVNDQNI